MRTTLRLYAEGWSDWSDTSISWIRRRLGRLLLILGNWCADLGERLTEISEQNEAYGDGGPA